MIIIIIKILHASVYYTLVLAFFNGNPINDQVSLIKTILSFFKSAVNLPMIRFT